MKHQDVEKKMKLVEDNIRIKKELDGCDKEKY